jgi:hypothetical protein
VQVDLVMDDVGGSEDSSWDAIWSSAGRLTGSGYEIEMAIPFTSLRFQRGEGDQTWGIDVLRIHPRDQRRPIGLNPLDRNVDCYLCQAAKITVQPPPDPIRFEIGLLQPSRYRALAN